jgi:hypothetical protein
MGAVYRGQVLHSDIFVARDYAAWRGENVGMQDLTPAEEDAS